MLTFTFRHHCTVHDLQKKNVHCSLSLQFYSVNVKLKAMSPNHLLPELGQNHPQEYQIDIIATLVYHNTHSGTQAKYGKSIGVLFWFAFLPAGMKRASFPHAHSLILCSGCKTNLKYLLMCSKHMVLVFSREFKDWHLQLGNAF